MKYLKRFESNEFSISEIVDTIKDICLELKDDGFEIDVKSPGETRVKTIIIEIKHKSFTFDKISEVYDRIKDYASQYEFKYYFKVKFLEKKYYTSYFTIDTPAARTAKYGSFPKPDATLYEFDIMMQSFNKKEG